VRFLRNKQLQEEADEVDLRAQKRDLERLYRTFKDENHAFKDAKPKDACDPARLKEYFQKHFTPTKPDATPIELINAPTFVCLLRRMESSREINSDAPTKLEIVDTLKSLKAYKSSNDLPLAYIKFAIECDAVLNEFERLFSLIWTTEKQPADWSHSKLVALWKGADKGKATDPKTYRGIQVGSALCKIMVSIILNRLKKWYDSQLCDQQQGFRQGRGTSDGIFMLKRVQQISKKAKKKVYALFIDLTAAFDHVNRDWMFESILQRLPNDSNKKLFRLLQSIYAHTTTALSQDETDIFEIHSGVRQGGPESPMLYNLYMDYVMRVFIAACKEANVNFFSSSYCIPKDALKTQSQFGLGKFGNVTVDWLGYADDLVLLFNNIKDLRLGLDILNKTFKRYKLEMNLGKTKTMIMNLEDDDYPTTIAKVDGKDIENVEVFTYLGCKVHNRQATTGDEELSLRKESASSRFYGLSMKFFNRKIALTTRVKLLNALVRTRLTYSCATWCLTKTQREHMNAEYTTTLRKMIRGGFKRKEDSYAFVYSNQQVYEICKTTSLDAFVMKQQRSYIAHIIRQEDESIAKKLLFENWMARNGREITLLELVIKNEVCTSTEFFNRAKNKTY
jgi:sorting nexin-29